MTFIPIVIFIQITSGLMDLFSQSICLFVGRCFSFCLFQFISCTRLNFFLKKNIFFVEDRFLPCPQHGFLRSEENVILDNSNTLGIWVFVCPAIFMDTVVKSNQITMVVLNPLDYVVRCYALKFCSRCYCHLMLLYLCGRWNIHKGQQYIHEHKHRQIPSASHMG